jgi:GTP-binding protein EngB required for normal cell division
MSAKEELKSSIAEVEEVITNSDVIDSSKAEAFRQIDKDLDDFKVYLPLIGNFNAGKSSLLNALFEEDEFLSTNIVPETAIATEILYDEKERIEAFDFDSSKALVTFDNLEELKNKDLSSYGYLKVYKNSPILKENQDTILVDMPGLDSNIDRHNSQILNYVNKDVVSFIAVVDIDDGGLKDSTLRFIDEINSYKLDFFVIVNKIDKKPPSEVKKIQEHIKTQISKYTSKPFVGLVSALDEEIEDFEKIFSLVDKERYIKAIFIPKVSLSIETLIKDLEVRKSAITMDTSEIDEKIEQFIEGIHEFDKQLRKEKRLVENKFSTEVVNSIVRDVRVALEQNIDRLIRALKTSQESFQMSVNEIIRPVIVSSLNKYSEQTFSVSVENLEVAQSDIFDELNGALNQTKSTFDTLTTTLEKTSKILNIPVLDTLLKFILTKLNPIISTISSVLDIISSIFGKSEEEKEKEEYEKLRENIKNRTIPEIIKNIKPSIRNILDETKENFFKEIEKSINKQKEELIASLNKAKEEKEKYKNEIENKLKSFENDIEKLEAINQKVLKMK